MNAYSAHLPSPPAALPAGADDAVSVIVPFYNEETNVVPVLDELRAALPEAEIVAVDDGSRDGTWEALRAYPNLRALRLRENRGQSAALFAGLSAATGQWCATIDGDGQNDPRDLPALLAQRGPDRLVCGYRAKRRDVWSKRAASRFANGLRGRLLDDGARDTGCALKVFPRQALGLLVPFNGLHRFLPAIFKRAGYTIVEVPVNHRPRLRGVSKYTNWERALRGVYDLFGVRWLLARQVRYPIIDFHHE